ncbi:ferrous iron transport protein A [Chryseobacterium sp. SC28]|uniref:FeoA family protein n=1 Tax=Chryseobacterium sp. SC28 TaxID=2268028 RepID=UPI001E40BE32|nr:FeoA family protein [Chryseobacterium sp. SC28]MCG2793773.1 ferrous iron transport protein A [Weeksellaceae bacterium]
MQKKHIDKLCCFPKNKIGKIIGYDNENLQMPTKILEMGLLPETLFQVLFQAPFGGPLYIEYGAEKTKVALREQEAKFIKVELLE